MRTASISAPELLDRAGAHVALEAQHINALARLLVAPRPGGGLGLLLLRLHERLAFFLVEQRRVQRVAHVVVALVERADLDLLVLCFARAREARDQHGEAAQSRDDQERLESEGGDVQPERHERAPFARGFVGAPCFTTGPGWQAGRPGRTLMPTKAGSSAGGRWGRRPRLCGAGGRSSPTRRD